MARELQAAASCWESLSTLEDQVLDPEEAKQRIAEITQRAKAYAKEVWANADPDDEWGPQRAVSNYWEAANKEMSEIHGHAQILPKILEALRGTQAMWRFNNWGYQANMAMFDTKSLFVAVYGLQKRHRLKQICEWMDVPIAAHTAIGDAEAAGHVLVKLARTGKLPLDLNDLLRVQADAEAKWRAAHPEYK